MRSRISVSALSSALSWGPTLLPTQLRIKVDNVGGKCRLFCGRDGKSRSSSRVLASSAFDSGFTWAQSAGRNHSAGVKGKAFPPPASFRVDLSCSLVFIVILSKTPALNREEVRYSIPFGSEIFFLPALEYDLRVWEFISLGTE